MGHSEAGLRSGIGAHEVVYSGGYAETYQADGVPHRRDASVNKKVRNYLTNEEKYDIVPLYRTMTNR